MNINMQNRNNICQVIILSIILSCFPTVVFGNGEQSQEGGTPLLSEKIKMSANMKVHSLSLRESIVYALRNNFDIEISRLDSQSSRQDITIEKSVFDPVLELSGSIENEKTPINSELVGGFETTSFTPFISEGKTANAVIQSMIPTGATLSLEYNVFKGFSDPNPFNLLNPAYETYIEASITQPLLKGAGWFYNRSLIYIARNDKKISLEQFINTAIQVSNTVQEAYWNLVKAIEDLRVARKSLERAEDLLEENKIEVEAGTLASVEVIDAESRVASRLEAVISAENAIKDKEDELKKILNLSGDTIISEADIIPEDKPVFQPKKIELKEAIKIAMGKRPEIKELLIEAENAGIEVKRRKNELYPRLDFTGGVRYSGLGDKVSSANDSTFSESFQGEFFTLTLEIPLGNRAAKSKYKKAKIEKRQAVLDIRKKELDVVVDVREAVREVMTNIERVQATRKARELAQERLQIEEKKYDVGRSTNLEILRAQEDLATAEGNELKAIIDYEISLGNLERAKGTILDIYGISIEDDTV